MVSDFVAVSDEVRTGEGYRIETLGPRRYERIVMGLANVVMVPLTWLSLLDGYMPSGPEKAHFRVQIFNPRGKRWTIAVATSIDEASKRRDKVLERIATVGFDCWSREGPIPDTFFAG